MTSPTPNIHRWRAFSLLAVAAFMTVMDLTIVNTALPTIGRKLHFSQTSLLWVVTAYGLAYGGFLLLGGRAADLLGRRRMIIAGLAVFTAASLGASLAGSEAVLIAMRAVQGLGAALFLPAALSTVRNMFTEGAERNKALGIWGGLAALGATFGVVFGGILTRFAGWQYVFLLNVPVGVVALLLIRRVVPETRVDTARRRYRPARRGYGDRRARAARVRNRASPAGRLGRGRNDRRAGDRRRPARSVPGDREPRRGTADAAADLPPENARRSERRRLPARRELLLVHLHRHPVHAAGARLLSLAGRLRVGRGGDHLDAVRRRLADCSSRRGPRSW